MVAVAVGGDIVSKEVGLMRRVRLLVPKHADCAIVPDHGIVVEGVSSGHQILVRRISVVPSVAGDNRHSVRAPAASIRNFEYVAVNYRALRSIAADRRRRYWNSTRYGVVH